MNKQTGTVSDTGPLLKGSGSYWRRAKKPVAIALTVTAIIAAVGVGARMYNQGAFSRKAAEQGDATAQVKLGYYSMPRLDEASPDYAETMKWFRKAAEQGNAEGQSALGTMYFIGRGVAQDHEQALKWYRLAAAQGDVSAKGSMEAIENNLAGKKQALAREKQERKKEEKLGPLVFSGNRVHLYNCELHTIQKCNTNKLSGEDRLDCLFTNNSKVRVDPNDFTVWNYDAHGILIENTPVVGSVTVPPGQTIHIEVLTNSDASAAVFCSMDPDFVAAR